MYPATFDYLRPSTIDEAVAMLVKHGDEAKLLAGGHSLIPAMKLRLARPGVVIDIGQIRALSDIRDAGGHFAIGAITTHQEIAGSTLLKEKCPLLPETAAHIGDIQVRNRGTIGGSVAHADPGADYPTVVTALGATIVAQGPNGERELAADDFFTGVFTTALQQGELVTAVRVPTGGGAAYQKHRHPASGYAVVGVAVVLRPEAARIVVGGVTGTPVRATEAEQAMEIGIAPVDEAAIAAVAEKVPAALSWAVSDTYASGEYRVHLAQVLAKRAIKAALEAA